MAARIAEAKDRAFADFKLATEIQPRILNAAVSDANARAAEANRGAEEEPLARIKIEARLATRRLTPQQASSLVGSLVAARATLPVVTIMVLGNPEAQIFRLDLVKAIQLAGVPNNLISDGVVIPPPYGLIVTDTPSGTLKAAFDAAGIPARYAPAVTVDPP